MKSCPIQDLTFTSSLESTCEYFAICYIDKEIGYKSYRDRGSELCKKFNMLGVINKCSGNKVVMEFGVNIHLEEDFHLREDDAYCRMEYFGLKVVEITSEDKTEPIMDCTDSIVCKCICTCVCSCVCDDRYDSDDEEIEGFICNCRCTCDCSCDTTQFDFCENNGICMCKQHSPEDIEEYNALASNQ